jgi:hypothetical protein
LTLGGAPAPDRCAVIEVGTATAVNTLARDGISDWPDRISESLVVGIDACAALGSAALSRVAGLDSNIRFPGFADWSCAWGPAAQS